LNGPDWHLDDQRDTAVQQFALQALHTLRSIFIMAMMAERALLASAIDWMMFEIAISNVLDHKSGLFARHDPQSGRRCSNKQQLYQLCTKGLSTC